MIYILAACGEQGVGGQAGSEDPGRLPCNGPGERPWQPGPGWGPRLERSGKIWGGVLGRETQWARAFWRWARERGVADDTHIPPP